MTKLWWKAAIVRAIRTAAQVSIAAFGTTVAVTDVNWTQAVSIATMSFVMSLLTSLTGLPEVKMIEANTESEE